MKKLLLLPLLLLTSCSRQNYKTPLGWCVWEIQEHENYEELCYTYQKMYPNDYEEESKYSMDCYAITTYTDELRTEWFCFIEYIPIMFTDLIPGKNIINIDCDVVWELNYEETGEVL